ncbi:MAG TPA: hypothetical protein VMT19_08015 [Thermoanaerobaculaceae bacterium]|nr:hypothetical protein [Thermoanaerobaculaceae bacterium]
MRTTARIAAVTALVLAVAAPAAAHHWHGGARWGWGFGIGPVWWGPWWGVPAWYQPGPESAMRQDLAVVDTDVTPEHARVVLDGQLIGVADDFDGYPGYLYLKPGRYDLEFTLKGYKTEKMVLNAEAGHYYPVDLKLERVPGEKPAPWYDRPEGLPVGRVFGPKQSSQPVEPKQGPDTTLRPELRERARESPPAARAVTGAALDLRVTPLNAAVYIDGKFAGTAEELGRLERGLAVAPGKHRIEVVAPGRTSKALEVEVADGQRQQIVVDLEGGAGQT